MALERISEGLLRESRSARRPWMVLEFDMVVKGAPEGWTALEAVLSKNRHGGAMAGGGGGKRANRHRERVAWRILDGGLWRPNSGGGPWRQGGDGGRWSGRGLSEVGSRDPTRFATQIRVKTLKYRASFVLFYLDPHPSLLSSTQPATISCFGDHQLLRRPATGDQQPANSNFFFLSSPARNSLLSSPATISRFPSSPARLFSHGPTMASDQASSGAASRVASRTDPGWKYCFPVQEGDTNTVVCSFCSKEMRGGITRAKQHLMAKKGNVAPCTKCPKEVREELWALLKEKEKGDSSGPPSDRVDVDDILYVESEDEVAVTPSSAARKKNAAKKGPLDLYCNAANAKRRREKMRQKDIQECCDKKAILRVHQKIARWWYQAGLSFNCIKLESFQEMLTEVGAYGPNIVAPTYHAIRVPLLNMEMEYTNELLKNHEEQWSKHGCSIMSDAWTDRKQRCIINFLVSSSAGTKFVKSIDGSNFVKTGEKLFELLDSLVEEIGEEKVVQIITDNGSNYVLAGKMLEEKRKHLYWTPCAAHCLDLMLEDIGKIPSIKKTIQRAISLVGFIYSHSSTLSLLRQFTNKRELVRHAVTRFATSFLSLERLYGEKSNLRKMFTSDEWNNNKLSKESKGKEASKVVLMPSFWNHVVFTLKVMAPLVRVLRLVDGEKKPAMGYIYEAMDKAKETIMKSFNNIESKYKDIFAIIDERWNCQLHRPLHAAGHFLNPEFFYANTDLEFDLEVTNGLYDCISRLVTSRDVQHKILAELPIYKSASGLFGGDFAISQRKTIAPAQWWRMYGHSAPNLQKLAIKILSLTCSASGCERNWSVFEQGSNGKSHFVFVTNLEPCSGVRLHLWPKKRKSTSSLPLNYRVVEVTSKMMHIPSGPAPRQLEPGSQTEQAPPSAVFWLGPEDMHGFRFLTISVAPRPTVSGRPPPAASMAVGQFFNPEEGNQDLSPWFMLQSTYSQKELLLDEAHPLAVKLSFAISLGLLPVTLSLKTVSCGIRNSELPEEEAGDLESSRLCKLRCFPPAALAWDDTSGLHIYPNLNSDTIFVDSSPAQWTSIQQSVKTVVLLLVDPHCSYKSSISISVSAAASRFLLLYSPKIVGFSIAVIFFALMRQAYLWDLDLRIPSMLTAVETNLTLLSHFFLLAILPIIFSFFLSLLMSQPFPPFASFIGVSLICYIFANGFIAVLVLISHLVFFVTAVTHIFIKTRWQIWERNGCFIFLHWFGNLSASFFSLKVVRVLRANPVLVTTLAATVLACLVHPAFGLLILLFSHFFCCHNALCSFLMASCRSCEQNNENFDSNNEGHYGSERLKFKFDDSFNLTFPSEDNFSNSPDSSKSFGDTQLDVFHHRHGLLILHLVATMMFAPSVVAWFQRLAMGESLPWLLDSVLSIGVILHGFCNSKPEFNSFLSLTGFPIPKVRLYFIYLIAGYWSYFAGLALAPYRAFYAIAAVGGISFALRMLHRRNRDKKEVTYGSRKHSHRN